MVSAHPPIFSSYSHLTKLLGVVSSTCPSFRFLWFLLCGPAGRQSHFFLLAITRSGLLAGIKWSVCISKFQRTLCVSFSRTDSGLCIYHLVLWWNFNFLHNSQWTTFPTQSCLFLYSFCVKLLHSIFMWLIVSSLPPHNLHLRFRCVLSIFPLK